MNHWAEKDLPVTQELDQVLAQEPAIVALSTGHGLYSRPETMDVLMEWEGLCIYDTIGVLSAEPTVRLRQRHIVKVPGRGDL